MWRAGSESQCSYLGRPVITLKSNPTREGRLRWQQSAKAIVPFFRDGLNNKKDEYYTAPAACAGVATVARVVKDKRVLTLIRSYLESGVMVNRVVTETEEGTSLGGPGSPLLSNNMLNDLDKELEKGGHWFVR